MNIFGVDCWFILVLFWSNFGPILVQFGQIIWTTKISQKCKANPLQIENNFLKFILEYLVSITIGGTSLIAPVFFKIFISAQKIRAETRTNQVLGWRIALRFASLTALFITLYIEISNCDLQNDLIDQLQAEGKIIIPFNMTDPEACSCGNALYLCWPVVLGQECFKLTIGWLLGQLGTVFCLAAPAKLILQYCGYKVPLISTFDITDNVLKIVSWQVSGRLVGYDLFTLFYGRFTLFYGRFTMFYDRFTMFIF